MLEKPNLADEVIVDRLRSAYDMAVSSVEFMPIGNDARAWSYRVETGDGDCFLKLRNGEPKLAALTVPHYLLSQGIDNVVAPLASRADRLFTTCDDFTLILYPFIEGKSAWGMPLLNEQWQRWGAIMRAIHQAAISPTLTKTVSREVFGVKWLNTLDRIERVLQTGAYAGPVATALAKLWRKNSNEIARARSRYLSLGAKLAADPPPFVLCHADIHLANIIINDCGEIRIVDWDETLIAPKERDLMFFLLDGHSREATDAFFKGYGDTPVNRLALAYYKYDWVLQEFGDYGERVFLADDLGAQDLALALREFKRLFAPGDVVERAHQAYDEYFKSSS